MKTNVKKNTKTADIECCVVNITTHRNKYVIAENIPISVGYICEAQPKKLWIRTSGHVPPQTKSRLTTTSNATSVLNVSKDLLLEIETENITKPIKPVKHMVKHFFMKVGIHSPETGKNRGPACKIRNLRYKQENFIPLLFDSGSGYDFNLLNSEQFKQNKERGSR